MKPLKCLKSTINLQHLLSLMLPCVKMSSTWIDINRVKTIWALWADQLQEKSLILCLYKHYMLNINRTPLNMYGYVHNTAGARQLSDQREQNSNIKSHLSTKTGIQAISSWRVWICHSATLKCQSWQNTGENLEGPVVPSNFAQPAHWSYSQSRCLWKQGCPQRYAFFQSQILQNFHGTHGWCHVMFPPAAA